ncbi:MAG: hypothetical protein GY822_16090 [Deltaproteobacteria bacterium]|nr:hypothetical protein [Deltaproteobacteria bacterium]
MVDVLVVEKGELGGLLAALLEQDGMHTQWARSAEEALGFAIETKPKVVVVEAEICEQTGIEIADLLRTDLDAKVVITYRHETLSLADAPHVRSRIDAQEASFKKPFRSRALIEKVASLLGRDVQRDVDPSLLDGAPIEEEPLELEDAIDVDLDDSGVLDGVAFLSLDQEFDDEFDINLSEDAAPVEAELMQAGAEAGEGATLDLPARETEVSKRQNADLTSLWSELKALSGANLSGPSAPDEDASQDSASDPQTAEENGEEDEISFASLEDDESSDDEMSKTSDFEEKALPGRSLVESSPLPPGRALLSTGEVAAPGKDARPFSARLLAETLDALHESETTSEILITRGKARRILLLLRGVIVAVRSNLRTEELPFLARKRNDDSDDVGKKLGVDDDTLEKAQTLYRAKKVPTLSHALLNCGVSKETLRSLLDEQVRRVVLGAFAWPNGEIKVSFRGLAKKEVMQSQLSVADAVVRSVVLSESMDELQKAAPDDARFAPNPDSSYGLQELTLSADEAFLVIAIDGTKTMQDLAVLNSDVSERVLRGLAAGLFRVGLLRFAGFGPAEARPISFF